MKAKKYLYLFLFVAGFSSQAFSLPISINGPGNVTPSSTQGYYYNAISPLSSPTWQVTGGTISYTAIDGGTQYSAIIIWGSAGTGTVTFKDGTTTLGTKNVTISVAASTFVGGGGDYCVGQTANVNVYNSVSGSSYQLYLGTHAVSTAKSGTGGTISWAVTAGGLYTAVASPGGTVSGSATVVMDPGPTVYYVVTGPGYCGGSRTITLSDSDSPSVGSSYFLKRDGSIVGSSVTGTGEALNWSDLTEIGTYTVTAQNGDGCPSAMDGNRVINPIPSAPPSIDSVDRCGPGSLTLSGTPGADGNSLNWYNTNDGGTYSAQGLNFVADTTVTTTYYASTYNLATGCESTTRTPAIATIKPLPTIAEIDQRDICSGESINITIINSNTIPGTTYNWTYSGADITGGSSGSGAIINQTLTRTGTTAAVPATYTIIATGGNGCIGLPSVASFNVKRSQIDCVDMNYVVSLTVLKEGILNPGDVEFLSVDSANQVIQYFDGLGRPMQSVTKQATPFKTDLVQPVSYDPYGREQYKYLPYAGGVNGRYKSDFITREQSDYSTPGNPQFQFYQETSTVPADTVPYSTVVFEASPLNRPTANYGPGQKWAENNKKVTYMYPINVDGTGHTDNQERIIIWDINSSGALNQYVSMNNGFYPTGSLSIKSVKDEQGNEVREYTNKEGQMILKKVYVTGSTSDFNTIGNWAETYYVYDRLGNLAVVLPPEAVIRIIQNN